MQHLKWDAAQRASTPEDDPDRKKKEKGTFSFSRLFRAPTPRLRTLSPHPDAQKQSRIDPKTAKAGPPVPPKPWEQFDFSSTIGFTPDSTLPPGKHEAQPRITNNDSDKPTSRDDIKDSKRNIMPGEMFVKALYDYEADEKTSLSFCQGDIIQVITQLESGWWDGVIDGVRGWFPSNYCAVVQRPDEASDDEDSNGSSDDAIEFIDIDDFPGVSSARSQDTSKVDEAAFWIPQATPDGRLFYFNTLTGVSTLELPLEVPEVPVEPSKSGTNDKEQDSSAEEEAAFWIPQATPDGRLFYFNTLTGVSTMELPSTTPPRISNKKQEPKSLPSMTTFKELNNEPEREPKTYGWESDHSILDGTDEEPFSVCNFLGNGSLGIVEEVRRTNTQLPTLVRKRVLLSARRLQAQATLKIIQEEAKNLSSLVHQHIITLLGSYEEKKARNQHFYCLLMSPVGDSDLRNFLEIAGEENDSGSSTDTLLTWKSWIYGWFACLGSALAFMHEHGIRHQDIKPSNIIHKGKHVYFTDFSSSCAFDVGHTTSTENPSRSSPMYAAPEIIDNYTGSLQRHGRATDIFALGCVYCDMLTVLTGRTVPAFQASLVRDTDGTASKYGRGMLCYSQRLPQISEWFAPSTIFSDHVCAMLQPSRDLRPTAIAVVQWFVMDNMFEESCTCWQHSLWHSDKDGKISRREIEAIHVRGKDGRLASLKHTTADELASIERHGIKSESWTTRHL